MLMIGGPVGVTPSAPVERPRKAADHVDPPSDAKVQPAEKAASSGGFERRSGAVPAAEPRAQPGAPGDARIGRPYAPLVAQLIAGKLGLAQTRTRRRGSLSDTVAAYRRMRRAPARPHELETEA